jgi:membrane protease YdiL (CAAX protease family)
LPRKIFFNDVELRAGWRFALYVLMAVVVGFVVVLLLSAIYHGRSAPSSFSVWRMLVNEPLQLAIFVIPALVMARAERRRFGEYGLPRRGAFGPRFAEGIVWGVGLQALTIATLVASGTCHISGFAIGLGGALGYGALWGIGFILVGLTEEFSFRGYSQYTLTTGMGFWPSALLLSVGFAAIHLNNEGENWVGAVGVFFAAMVLVLPLRRTGTLWFSVGLHAGWDWTETYLFGVPDSGVQAKGYLLNTSFQGSKWLTGGAVGPEASIVALVILALAFVALHFRFRETCYATHPPSPDPEPMTTLAI